MRIKLLTLAICTISVNAFANDILTGFDVNVRAEEMGTKPTCAIVGEIPTSTVMGISTGSHLPPEDGVFSITVTGRANKVIKTSALANSVTVGGDQSDILPSNVHWSIDGRGITGGNEKTYTFTSDDEVKRIDYFPFIDGFNLANYYHGDLIQIQSTISISCGSSI